MTSMPAPIAMQSSKGSGSTVQHTSTPAFGPAPPPAVGSERARRAASGAASYSRPAASARNTQGSRKQHKTRHPKLDDEDSMAEAAAIRSTKSRKGQTSITHLMNFSLPPRPSIPQDSRRQHRAAPRIATWTSAVDKARYVHANYRFVVDSHGHYRTDVPDERLEWTNVLQILMSPQSQATNCPICLSEPVAPRMAKCGHVFCLPCLMRYIDSSPEVHALPEKKAKWHKCPICHDLVYLRHVRPAKWFQGQETEAPHEGQDLLLRLMARAPPSCLALPRDCKPLPASATPWYSTAEIMDYARVMLGDDNYMHQEYGREVEVLQIQEQEDELLYGEDPVWIRKAISAIRQAQHSLQETAMNATADSTLTLEGSPSASRPRASNSTVMSSEPPGTSLGNSESTRSLQAAALTAGKKASDRSRRESDLAAQLHKTTITTRSDTSMLSRSLSQNSVEPPAPRTSSANLMFFYQALPHVYLSSLDIRILKATFGDYSAFPSTVLPRVERVSGGHVVDEELRRRAKHLSHLPLGCEITFVECDWTDIVPETTLAQFRPDLERRRRKHSEKDAREEKERVRAEREEEDSRWAWARRRRNSWSLENDPTPTPALGTSAGQLLQPGGAGASGTSPPWTVRNGSGFAALASPSTSPTAQRTVWGTAAIVADSPSAGPQLIEDDVTDAPDGWLQGWELDLLRGADDGPSTLQVGGTSDAPPTMSSNGGLSRKKKGKKITLMTTNARRAA